MGDGEFSDEAVPQGATRSGPWSGRRSSRSGSAIGVAWSAPDSTGGGTVGSTGARPGLKALPSAALGILGGGTVAVDTRDANGGRKLPGPGLVEAEGAKATRTTEPVFEIRAQLQNNPAVSLLHGQRAVARMTLEPTPLGEQWWRRLRQAFQHTYKL